MRYAIIIFSDFCPLSSDLCLLKRNPETSVSQIRSNYKQSTLKLQNRMLVHHPFAGAIAFWVIVINV